MVLYGFVLMTSPFRYTNPVPFGFKAAGLTHPWRIDLEQALRSKKINVLHARTEP